MVLQELLPLLERDSTATRIQLLDLPFYYLLVSCKNCDRRRRSFRFQVKVQDHETSLVRASRCLRHKVISKVHRPLFTIYRIPSISINTSKMSSDELSSDWLAEQIRRKRQNMEDDTDWMSNQLPVVDEHVRAIQERGIAGRPQVRSPPETQSQGLQPTGSLSGGDFDTPMDDDAPGDAGDLMDVDADDADSPSSMRKHPRPPLGDDESEPEGSPAKKTGPKKKGKATKTAKRKTQEDQADSTFDSSSMFILDGEGRDTAETSNCLVPLSSDPELHSQVQSFWNGTLRSAKYLQYFAMWTRKRPADNCAASRTIARAPCKRENQSGHQACSSCVTQGRPCLIHFDNKIVLLPRVSISPASRFGYF